MNKVADWLSHKSPVSRKNAAETVFEDLRGAILAGRLPVGIRLPSEAKLAEHYGVSRPIIREAMRSLQTLGLTRSRSGSGSFVISDRQAPELAYGNYSARELIEARPFIEIPAAGWAALRRSDEDMARLLQLCDSMERQEDALKWVRLDSDFHCLIAEAARNRLFARIVTDSRDALMRQSELVNLMADRRITSNLEHRRIAEAIAAGSETEARTAMRDHLDEVEQAMTWIISQRPANS
ncbi:FadR family transcriptional regulator (plasmid) [Paracoccus versutus]|uniref:DNA-binding FadR family transcriptional regulator n=1 Tax=Paracoccus versutus TaxID=34007 RepID=A0A099FHW8_PARVE|nr:FadR/GntR family transcriptional regulator [Paracoccus versutus]MBT0782085.1 FadR family transcriptional regulator [Paracoccus sp. pheM1]WGR63445.1 FadR family transcriptional regulator [Paracoccus ferrooxidans]SFY29773.1 DNA-binding transcriptional regulator, FadR family [Paracoccus pantotrophus]KGJ09856.1 GntR family transcriptional regulator [Paracoccus versutus]RDD71323.1 FadR family transcriptional regulator [Paracoccus versutus]